MKSDICRRQYQDKLETGIVEEYYKNEMKKKKKRKTYPVVVFSILLKIAFFFVKADATIIR